MKNRRKNKILAFGIILCMLFSLAVVPTFAEIVSSGTCGDNLTWTLDDEGTLTISGTGDMTDYARHHSTPWYSLRESISSITIENGVTSIGDYAFDYCRNLTSITIPDSVTSIDDHAFEACLSLENVTFPNYITSIGYMAFALCCSLTSITIPDSVTIIGFQAFWDCSILTSIDVSESNQNYSSQDGVLLNKDKTEIICCPSGKQGSYTVPDSVTIIGESAFNMCSLTSIVIPDGVTHIVGFTFFSSSFESVTLPESIIRIESNAFYGCGLAHVYYGGSEDGWNSIYIEENNDFLTNANIHYYNTYELSEPLNYDGKTHYLPKGCTIITTDDLFFRNGYIQSRGGYIKAGDKKITGENIYFTNEGKIRLGAGFTAKVELDNGDGTTDQGFMAGIENPKSVITMTLEISGTANDIDYTGRTVSKDFDFTHYEVEGLVNFGFTVTNIPKPLSLSIKSIE